MTAPAGASSLRRLAGSVLGAGMLPWIPGTWGSLVTVLGFLALTGTAGLDGALGEGLLGPLLSGGAEAGAGALPAGEATGVGGSAGADEAAGASGLISPALLLWLALIALVTLVGIAIGNRAHQDWGRGDPGPFVLDEVAGQLIALLPLLPGPVDPLGALVAFGAFRAFDILKPPPIRQLERLPRGVGIMADDLAAGLLAMIPVALLI
ncbi:MAG: hypothetical protein DRQ55_05550 [Planctomycetota bacterium]|nr:MAG: hypothetical protein DRQ55_05550 [Planctomycetota bacterium]